MTPRGYGVFFFFHGARTPFSRREQGSMLRKFLAHDVRADEADILNSG